MNPARIVITQYKGPSRSRGSAVSAKHVTTLKRIRRAWDPALGTLENHAAAAAELLGGAPEFYASVEGGGYIFGRQPGGEEG